MLAMSVSALAQDDRPPMDLPIYPGSETAMEINMTSEDILPMVKAMIPLFGDRLGKLGEKISADDIGSVLKDITRIQVLQLDVAKAGVNESDVVAYYTKNMPSGKWSRLFYQSVRPAGTVALFSQNGAGTLYGFRVRTVTVDDKPIKRIEIAKTEGKIDFVKLLTLAGKYMEVAQSGK